MSWDPIVENELRLDFGPSWTTVIRWDRYPVYRDGMSHAWRGKGIDVLAVLGGKVVYFIEVKDYRYHERDPTNEAIDQVLELKYRSTIAALVGAYHRGKYEGRKHYDTCAAIVDLLLEKRRLRLLSWYEATLPERILLANREQRLKVGARTKARVPSWIDWLDMRPEGTNLSAGYQNVLPDVVAQSLPRERRKKAEEIIVLLQGNCREVPDEVRWRIKDSLDFTELDDMKRRAATLRDPRELLRPRK